MKVSKNDISLSELKREEVPVFAAYLAQLGDDPTIGPIIDKTKIPSEEQLIEKLSMSLPLNKVDSETLIIHLNGQAIGHHSINPLQYGDCGVFHAHIWQKEHRRLGICSWTYPMAGIYFIEKFHLKRIVYNTPRTNEKAVKLKEKIGYRAIGEGKANNSGLLVDGTEVVFFEADLKFLKTILHQLEESG